MKLVTSYSYTANVIMPRKRNPIEVMVQDKVTVEIKEYKKVDAPVAFIVDGEKIHFFNKKLWKICYRSIADCENKKVTLAQVKENTENCGENYKYSSSSTEAPFYGKWHSARYRIENGEKVETTKELKDSCREWVSDNKRETLKEIRSSARNLVSIDGIMYETTSEPRYFVITFGLGRNHGGTGMGISHFYNSNLRKDLYFNALQYDEACRCGKEVANNRGDMESVRRIGYSKIEVLMPEAVKLKPNKKRGKLKYEDILEISKSRALKVEEFDEVFPIIQNGDEIMQLDEYSDAISHSKKYDEVNPYRHIWTCVDGESNKLILLNGYHLCNRLYYVVSPEPWGTGEDTDKDIYIEAEY